MRVVVIGTSGAGKTTLAKRMAAWHGLPHIELDAINWQPAWRDLTRHDPALFVEHIGAAIRTEGRVVNGN